jgi:hypothetical protein
MAAVSGAELSSAAADSPNTQGKNRQHRATMLSCFPPGRAELAPAGIWSGFWANGLAASRAGFPAATCIASRARSGAEESVFQARCCGTLLLISHIGNQL